MENVPALEVTPSPTSADEASNAAFALAMGELVETIEQESEDDA